MHQANHSSPTTQASEVNDFMHLSITDKAGKIWTLYAKKTERTGPRPYNWGAIEGVVFFNLDSSVDDPVPSAAKNRVIATGTSSSFGNAFYRARRVIRDRTTSQAPDGTAAALVIILRTLDNLLQRTNAVLRRLAAA